MSTWNFFREIYHPKCPGDRTYHILKNQNPKFKEYAETTRTGKEESDKFENMVMRAYDCNLITIDQAATFLGAAAAEIEYKSLII